MGFNAIMQYPGSRIGVTTTSQCERCKSGRMRDSPLRLTDADGMVLEMLKWTCDYCGYTMLFDIDVVLRRASEASDHGEVFPEWVERLRRERQAR